MLFNTAEFAVFFAIVWLLYWTLRSNFRAQNAMLLAASYIFYGWWDVRFLFLIVISTTVDYIAALMVDRGSISVRQRLAASFFLLGSAFFFVVLQYDAVTFTRSGLSFSLDINWPQLVSSSIGWWVLAVTTGLALIANLLYPVFLKRNEKTRRKTFMVLSIVSNLTILGFFKYFNFFSENLITLSESLFGVTPGWWTLNIILPVGISFYTFQTMSYTIDVYRKQLKASTDMMEFATYVAFFPQLVAGPIERGKHLLPQFRRRRPALTGDSLREGAWLIAWGLYKKMVIADSMATIVNATFAPYDGLTAAATVPDDGLRLLIAIYAFALQIYCDFSGYTDIARGTAKLLGFDIMLNFNLPYFATSPSAFWSRWHISLSSWLRDYLYIPLGGNRGTAFMTYRNLALTMLLGGLWHGAAWNFVLWGAYHGTLLGIYRALGLRTEKGAYPWWVLGLMGIIMFHLTCVGWLLFRAQNVSTISIFLQSIFINPFGSPQALSDFKDLLYYGWFLIAFQVIQGTTGTLNPMARWHWFIRLNVWIFIIMSLVTIAGKGGQEFIYFAF